MVLCLLVASLVVVRRVLVLLKRRDSAPLAVMVVLPERSFDSTRREMEARLTGIPDGLARLQIAEDLERGWTRSFEVKELPALFLMNGRRQFVWNAQGRIDPAGLSRVLDEHAVSTRARNFAPARVRVSVGSSAPDLLFEDADGQQRALHRFLGRPVVVTFWHSSSAASLNELQRLQTMIDRNPRTAAVVVGFHGGAVKKHVDSVRKTRGISFILADDREHRAARAFGVRCWPTTVAIDANGRITGIQLGLPGSSS